jgi:hypothetical protein
VKACSIPGVECGEFQSITLKIAPSVGRSCIIGWELMFFAISLNFADVFIGVFECFRLKFMFFRY